MTKMYKFTTTDIVLNKEDSHIRHKEIEQHFPYGQLTRYRCPLEGSIYEETHNEVIVTCSQFPVTSIKCSMSVIPMYDRGTKLHFKTKLCASEEIQGHDVAITALRDQIKWFQKIACSNGFSASLEDITQIGYIHGWKNEKRTHYAVDFKGQLEVINADLFNMTLGTKERNYYGIGSGKHAGLGLLIVN